MDSNKGASVRRGTAVIDEMELFERVSVIIDERKRRAYAHASQEVTMMFWEVGRYINLVLLEDKRAEYGKKILTTLSENW